MSLFSIAEARAFDKRQLDDAAAYPDAAITAEIARIAALFSDVCGVAFESTAAIDTLDGDGTDTILLSHLLPIAVTKAETRIGLVWTELTAAELADLLLRPSGLLVRDTLGAWPSGRRNVRITYTHGFSAVPAEIKRAALKVVVDTTAGLVPTNLPSRAMSLSDEFGTFRLATPGIGNSITGIPEVDEVLNRYRRQYAMPVVG